MTSSFIKDHSLAIVSTAWKALRYIKAKHDYIPWNEFERTVFTGMDGLPWYYSQSSHEEPLFVITACCPYSINIGDQLNGDLHGLLKWHIDSAFPLATKEAIVGHSEDGLWHELSWAITGISKEDALSIGALFHQWAVFSFNGNERVVLQC
jgi:hypothetical protein